MFSRCLNGFASSTGSSRLQLASGQGRTTQPLRSSPITGPSTLLRAAPPLRPASVLSPSRLEPLAACPLTVVGVTRLRFSRSIRKPGRASRRLHAGCRSGSIRASSELIPEEGSPPVLTSLNPLSTLLQRFASARLSRPCLPKSCPGVSATITTTAFAPSSSGGLRSVPDHRTRRALFDLSYSCAPQITHMALVTHDLRRHSFRRVMRHPATWHHR